MRNLEKFSGSIISKTEMKTVNGGQTCHANTNANGQVISYGYGGCGNSSSCYEYTCPRVVAYS